MTEQPYKIVKKFIQTITFYPSSGEIFSKTTPIRGQKSYNSRVKKKKPKEIKVVKSDEVEL